MIKTILVPLDRSGLAEQALPFAVKLASRIHANIVLATVLTDTAPSDGWNAAVWQQSEEETAVREAGTCDIAEP
jgi:nucleotide-binding universal stress UspA family protein